MGGEQVVIEIKASASTAGSYTNTATMTADNQSEEAVESATVTVVVRAASG